MVPVADEHLYYGLENIHFNYYRARVPVSCEQLWHGLMKNCAIDQEVFLLLINDQVFHSLANKCASH